LGRQRERRRLADVNTIFFYNIYLRMPTIMAYAVKVNIIDVMLRNGVL
jgi:hypothetical protein